MENQALCDGCQQNNGSEHTLYKYQILLSAVRRTKRDAQKNAILLESPQNRSFASYVVQKMIRSSKDCFVTPIFYDRSSVVLMHHLQKALEFYVNTDDWPHNDWKECCVELIPDAEDTVKLCAKNVMNDRRSQKDFLIQASVFVLEGLHHSFTVTDGVFLYDSPSTPPPNFAVTARTPFRQVILLGCEESQRDIVYVQQMLSDQWAALQVIKPILLDNVDAHPLPTKKNKMKRKYCWTSQYAAFYISRQPLTYGKREEICRRIGDNVHFLQASSKDVEMYTLAAGAITMKTGCRAGLAGDGVLLRRTLVVGCDTQFDCVGFCMNAAEKGDIFMSGYYPLDPSLDVSCAVADVVNIGFHQARQKRGGHVDSIILYVPSSMEKDVNAGMSDALDRILKQAFKHTPEICRPLFAVVAVHCDKKIFQRTISDPLSESPCEDPSQHNFELKLHYGYAEEATPTTAVILIRSPRMMTQRQIQEFTENLCFYYEQNERCLAVPLPLFNATKAAEEIGQRVIEWKFYCRKDGNDDGDFDEMVEDDGEFDDGESSSEDDAEQDEDDDSDEGEAKSVENENDDSTGI